MLWRIANAFIPGTPIQFDRVLGGSYNTRSALEALLAHTPEFYWCLPGRIESLNTSSKIKRGHKHVVWLPDRPHENGVLEEFETDQVISELPSVTVLYESLALPDRIPDVVNIDVKRRHLQVQIALVMIGVRLGFRTWIAYNDRGFKYGETRVGDLQGVLPRLEDVPAVMSVANARSAAMQIDCIWFRNGRFMPAVMEVEHSTGVTSGLTRMKHLQDQLPPIQTRWVIVASDDDRKKVVQEANKPQFESMDVSFFPYSAVDELYALCQRRKLTKESVNDPFLDAFMEPCLARVE